jgi:DNA repair exonuclease SbcCD nuclease subunit
MIVVISDTHIGAIRAGGTTPVTAYALRQHLLRHLERLVNLADDHLAINGDLFDTKLIPLPDLLATYGILAGWLNKNPLHRLTLIAGNHDLSRNQTELSSFEFLCKLLEASHSGQAFSVFDLTEIAPGLWALPHVANQDLFDAKLDKVPECAVLLVHCNFDNGFAQESDHSLNMSKEQALACKAEKILFGHEHDSSTRMGGKVIIPGNQIPSSVMDCLRDEVKQYTTISDGTVKVVDYEKPKFEIQDWKSLRDTGAEFVRVSGKVTGDEAADAASAIARFRGASKAYVITNAVEVEQIGTEELVSLSLEKISAFDVLAALKETLTTEEVTRLEALDS